MCVCENDEMNNSDDDAPSVQSRAPRARGFVWEKTARMILAGVGGRGRLTLDSEDLRAETVIVASAALLADELVLNGRAIAKAGAETGESLSLSQRTHTLSGERETRAHA